MLGKYIFLYQKIRSIIADFILKIKVFQNYSGCLLFLVQHIFKMNSKFMGSMKALKKAILPISLAAVWISLSEFIRNEFLLKSLWIEHYSSLGLVFPSEPINGAIWGIWSLFFAIAIYILSNKYTLFQTTIFSWFIGFVLMWIVIGNLHVLPYQILYFAVPLSFIEAFLAAYICWKFKSKMT